MTRQYANGEVEFRFYRPSARQVSLLGDFNDWETTALRMRLAENGWWHCRLALHQGVYQFRYLADGQWYLDYAAFGLEKGLSGEWNSVLMVEPLPVQENHQPEEGCTSDGTLNQNDQGTNVAYTVPVGAAA